MYNVKLIRQVAARCGYLFRVRRAAADCVEMNPGCLNAHSIVREGTLFDSHRIDALAICESHVVVVDSDAIKMDAVPVDFEVLHVPSYSSKQRRRSVVLYQMRP